VSLSSWCLNLNIERSDRSGVVCYMSALPLLSPYYNSNSPKNIFFIFYTLGETRNLLSNGMSFHRLLCILFLHATLSSASIYPTTPISKTIFTAGQPAKLKWMEDGRPPLLRDTGRVKIQLFAGNEASFKYFVP